MFRAKSGAKVTDVTDGTSNTAAMSESILGQGKVSNDVQELVSKSLADA